MNYFWCLTLVSLNFVFFVQSTKQNVDNIANKINSTMRPEGNIILINSTLPIKEKSEFTNLETNKTNLEENTASSLNKTSDEQDHLTSQTDSTIVSENINSTNIQTNDPTDNAQPQLNKNKISNQSIEQEAINAQVIQTPNIDIDYSNDFDLTIQMEKAYNQTEYNYNEENSETLQDAEEVSDKDNSHHDDEDTKEYLDWQEKVADFEVGEMLTIKIKSNRYTFYEEIHTVPSHIKVAFFNSDRGESVDFFIQDNKKNALFTDLGRRYGYHEFNATTPGIYKFILDGSRSRNTKKITFAIHTGNNTDAHLDDENIDRITQRLKTVKKKMHEVKTRQNFFMKSIERYFENTQKNNKHIVTMTFVECMMMLIILMVQFLYLKSLFNKF